jgi:transposase
MMGHQLKLQQKLFYERIRLEQRIRSGHVLRQIAQHIDFDFIYREVQDSYGVNGNVSVPPPVIMIMKMMLLLILYNVHSERGLLSTIRERLYWLWFLGFDLDDEIPKHSVLSKTLPAGEPMRLSGSLSALYRNACRSAWWMGTSCSMIAA